MGQLPCDGRTSQAPDQPTHFLGFPISYPPVHTNDTREWWNGLYGMTTKPIGDLVGLARSWSQAPELVLRGNGFLSAGFDRGERAYQLARSGAEGAEALACEIRASTNSPVVYLAMVVRNWGSAGATLQINGQPLAGETNSFLIRTNVSVDQAGDYSIQVTTPFQSLASPPLRIDVVPHILTVAPAAQSIRQGSNAGRKKNILRSLLNC